MHRKGSQQSRAKAPSHKVFSRWVVKLVLVWVCPCAWVCTQAARVCAPDFVGEQLLHNPSPSVVTAELSWFIARGAPARYADVFLPGGRWSSSERWATLFCPDFLILQVGLNQLSICWRLRSICSTVSWYLVIWGVRFVHINHCIVQSRVIFLAISAFCLSNQTPPQRHSVQYLWNYFQFTSYLGYMCLSMSPCPPPPPCLTYNV